MKKILSYLLAVTVVSFAIVSCKDNFNERDFLNLQSKLKLKQDSITRARAKAGVDSTSKQSVQSYVNALAAAGKLLSFTVTMRDNNVPIAGVAVTISSGSAGGRSEAASVITVSTDANGNSVFDNLPFGKGAITVSKTGYISGSAGVDFGGVPNPIQINIPTPNGTQVYFTAPPKQFQNAILPLFSKTGGSTATIKGNVTIETDLTNKTPEIPQGITVMADLSALAITSSASVLITNYRFDDANLGSAVVSNTTGAYSLIVPATLAGTSVSLIFPVQDVTQKIAVINLDGAPIATGPQYRNVPSQFGTGVMPSGSIPVVAGAKSVYSPSPVNPGAGVKFNFTLVPRPLNASGGNWANNYNSQTSFQLGQGPTYAFNAGATQYQLTNPGAGYTSGPAMAITGGGATTDAQMEASLAGVIKTIAVNVGGTGYTGTFVTVQMRYKDIANNNININTFSAPITISGGAIATISLPATNTGIIGVDPTNPYHTINYGNGYGIQSFDVVISGGGGTGATATTTFSNFVDGIRLKTDKGGAGYTSAPTITFSGGGATTQATMVVQEFRTKWTISIDNSGNTTPYKILPSAISWGAMHTGGQFFTDSNVNDQFNSNSQLYNNLTVSGGQIVFINPNRIYTTSDYSLLPSIIIQDYIPQLAQTDVFINTDGTFNFLNFVQNGVGYDSKVSVAVSPMITGAPGAGCLLELDNGGFNNNTREYQFTADSYTVKSVGAGYLTQLNQQNLAPLNAGFYPPTLLSPFTVKSGQIYIRNYNYGTGNRKENVD